MDDLIVSDGTMPCPVPSGGGLPCVKRIPKGWTADEGHGGGHYWISPETQQAMERGHYDARAVLAGEWFTIHQPEDCTPECPHWSEGTFREHCNPPHPAVTLPSPPMNRRSEMVRPSRRRSRNRAND